MSHEGPAAAAFVDAYFSTSRRVGFVGGAGFDPRAREVLARIKDAGAEVAGLLIKEVRPDPPADEKARADDNLQHLMGLSDGLDLVEVAVFGADGAVVGGRNVVLELARVDMSDRTDVVIDLSALSVGIGFPVVRYLLEAVTRAGKGVNVHVFVTHNPELDGAIRSVPSDSPGYVHGYRGESTLDASAGAARLWLPHLASGSLGALNTLHGFVRPHDTCPVLPFPSRDPRTGDRLAEEYVAQFRSAWEVDPRNVVYADEADPLDLYRTILQLDDLRRPVFEEAGGSLLILSPIGSKVMALGAMLAALERDLPVAHLETIGYEMDGIDGERTDDTLLHVWLEGDAYPAGRPALAASSGVR